MMEISMRERLEAIKKRDAEINRNDGSSCFK